MIMFMEYRNISMQQVTEKTAIEFSRKFFGLKSTVPASAWLVSNLLESGGDYYLVVFGKEDAAVAVASVSAQYATIEISALLKGTSPHLTLSREKALELCAAAPGTKIHLVWKPCDLSRSPLYPIWEVESAGGVFYVSQGGVVCDRLNDRISA